MGSPSLAEGFESAPPVGRSQFDKENVAQLAVEVGRFGLRPLEHPHHHLTQRRQPLGDDPQGHRFADPRLARDHREPALLDQLLDPPAEICSLRTGRFRKPLLRERASWPTGVASERNGGTCPCPSCKCGRILLGGWF